MYEFCTTLDGQILMADEGVHCIGVGLQSPLPPRWLDLNHDASSLNRHGPRTDDRR